MPQREPSVDGASWRAALLDLFGGGWTFAQVGPRRHEDWRRDAATVMALRSTDPRKWSSLNYAPEIDENRSGIGSPFMPWSPEQLGECLYEVGREPAGHLLVALRGDQYQAAGIPDFERRRDSLSRSSRRVLSRFGPEARFFTNASVARDNPSADLLNPDAMWECLSVHTTDCGLIALSDTEIGVFWAFWED
ncbi:hypothetical protein [Streptomyces solaniscabiei]|uniref:hypothetical protein n=1 Tax=Streptomyces solaniscabiei TaxID=2683255 RepID=UPI001CE37C7E|nr:hypothetical protein [Streptomyces solaniscabiei]